MAYINVCYFIISHIFPFADILFETALFPFLIGLRFDIWFLFLLPQICVSLSLIHISYKRWEFDMENTNMRGHWIGVFTSKGNETEIDFTEYVTANKIV